MSNHFLDRFKVILLDMNGTFMFGQDRFGAGEDFAATYRGLGGGRLAAAEVERAVRATYDRMKSDEEDPARYDDFPQVAEVLWRLHPSLPTDELNRIEQVIASHELGQVTEVYADCLRQLAGTYRLGLVANIWSKKDRWLQELKRAGVLELLEFPVFSSDYRSMKPSPLLFDLAFRPFRVGKQDAVFVGDSEANDIQGAKGFGISAIWINPSKTASTSADYVVSDLRELLSRL
ncbi:MAG TPA: HAD family hydrolase [Pirellulales bacterium]|nr:HAD family hydrolase [Pirellulales bacterium]